MSVSHHAFRVPEANQEVLDRELRLPFSQLFVWMQSARMRLPWIGVGYHRFSEEAPSLNRRLVVRAQGLRLIGLPQTPPPATEITVRVRLGVVGRTSMELLYGIEYGGVPVAEAVATMVCVSGKAGAFKPSPIPDRVRALGRPAGTTSGLAPTLDQSAIRRLLGAVITTVPTGGSPVFTHTVRVRFSDEDVNKHANHSAYAKFCVDTVEELRTSSHPLAAAVSAATGGNRDWVIGGLALEYVAETRAKDVLDVHLYQIKNQPCELAAVIMRDGQLSLKAVISVLPMRAATARL